VANMSQPGGGKDRGSPVLALRTRERRDRHTTSLSLLLYLILAFMTVLAGIVAWLRENRATLHADGLG
jgi:hypothetical protein